MKKILLFTLIVLFAAPCFAQKTYFTGLPLFAIPSEKGKDVYQLILSENKQHEGRGTLTLTVEETNEKDFDLIFWADLNERDHEGTYRQMREVNYNKLRRGAIQDVYVTNTYYLVGENDTPDTAIFQVKRAIQTKEVIRIYTFVFEQKLTGPDVEFLDLTGNKKIMSPTNYFNYIIQTIGDRWTEEVNDLILPLFNK